MLGCFEGPVDGVDEGWMDGKIVGLSIGAQDDKTNG